MCRGETRIELQIVPPGPTFSPNSLYTEILFGAIQWASRFSGILVDMMQRSEPGDDKSSCTAEQKVRDWLSSVPIGEGASRGWDEKQIEEISQFATSRRLEHLSAEGIYSKYVDHQIEKANEF